MSAAQDPPTGSGRRGGAAPCSTAAPMHRSPGLSLSTTVLLFSLLVLPFLLTAHAPSPASGSVPAVRSPQGGAADVRHQQGGPDLYTLLAEAFRGEAALATTDHVQGLDLFRVPGNRGFDASLDRVASILQQAGYRRLEGTPPAQGLEGERIYWFEEHPMAGPAWDPEYARLQIAGTPEPLLIWPDNFNMIAIGSASTPAGGIRVPMVYAGSGSPAELDAAAVEGKVVLADASPGRLYQRAVIERGAAGVLAYRLAAYNRPEENLDAILFGSIRPGTEEGWALCISPRARRRLLDALEDTGKRGEVLVEVEVRTRRYPSVERTLLAEVRGNVLPGERMVFSAHVQEPGANDNASGVACQAEMARTAARLLDRGALDPPARTLTFLWGDEISALARWLREAPARTEGVRWGISLDMVGENTQLTGGSFLIEKMPDPSAVWTRGEDRHTEWGGRPVGTGDLVPHFLNDWVLARFLEQAERTGWTVRTNPYEGGSDHGPFLREDIPAVLLWHFTDQFYHTDLDRIDKVSERTLENVGVSALAAAWPLLSGDEGAARRIAAVLGPAARRRLEAEYRLSRAERSAGAPPAEQAEILRTWAAWYEEAVRTCAEVPVEGPSPGLRRALEAGAAKIRALGDSLAAQIKDLR